MNFLLDLADPWGYVVVFLLGLAEGAALLGLFLPGETAMILGGVLVAQGRAALGGMLLAGCLGSALGDSIGYWVGHRFGGSLQESRLGRKIGRDRWERALRFLQERGPSAVFFGRFLGFLRTLVPPLAGSSELSYGRFAAFNIPAATLWAAVFVMVGFLAGEGWRVVKEWAGRASLVLLILLGVGILLFIAARWVRRRVEVLKQRMVRWLQHPTAVRWRERARPFLAFTRSRFDPAERFGLFLTLGLAVALASAVALGALVDSAAEGGDAIRFDRVLLGFFAEHRDPHVESAMQMLARAATIPVIVGVTSVVVIWATLSSKQLGWFAFGAALLAGGLVLDDLAAQVLELLGMSLVAHAPVAEPVFPSPQLTAAGAALGGMTYALDRSRSASTAVVVSAATLFVFFSATVAFLYLGRQTPSATAAGFFLGLLWAAVTVVSSNQLWHPTRSRVGSSRPSN